MVRPWMLLAVAAAVLAGCGGSERNDDVEATAERFNRAVESRDRRAACDELTDDARTELEKTEKKPCEEAILGLQLSPSRVTNVEVYATSAVAELSGGGSVFLDDTPEGWKIAAAGCKPEPGDQPYDCELET